MDWLSYHRFEELKSFIANDAAAKSEVSQLLAQDTALILAELSEVHQIVTSISASMTELRGLATTMVPGAEFSQQAISILRQMVNAHTEIMVCSGDAVGAYLAQMVEGPPIEYSDDKFLKDDMETLEAAGLLSSRLFGSGRAYRITRRAEKFIRAVPQGCGGDKIG